MCFLSPRKTSIVKNEEEQSQYINDLHEWIQVQGLAYYKLPRIYVVVEAIPKSASGKIVRKDLGSLKGKRHFIIVKRTSKM